MSNNISDRDKRILGWKYSNRGAIPDICGLKSPF